MTTDIIQQLQDDVWGILTNDPGFTFVPVYRARTPLEKDADGNPLVGQTMMIEENIEQILGGMKEKNGKCGIVAIVMLPDVQPESVESRGPALEMTIIVRIIEDRLFNEGATGTGITSSRLGLHALQVLHRRSIDGVYTIRPAARNFLEEVPLPGDRKAQELRMVMTRSLDKLDKAAKPGGAFDTDVLTLTCATEDAEIWWSQDGSWPGPQNPAALKYEAPMTETGDCVRAVAYHPDMAPSDDAKFVRV